MDGISAICSNVRQWAPRTYFLVVMLIVELILCIATLATNGSALDDLLFEIKGIAGSDYFDCLRYDYNMSSDIYSPMAQTYFLVLSYVTYYIPKNMHEFWGMVFYYIYFAATYVLIFFFINKISKLTNNEKKLLCLVLFFSLPSLYCLERGNVILLVVLLLLMFLYFYNSEDRRKKLFAYVCLGMAIGFKLYPAIFLFLFLRDRDYRHFLICTVICLAIFFIPFLFTNGTIEQQFNNIFSYAGSSQTVVHYDHINIENILMCIACALNVDVSASILNWICYGLAVLLLVCMLFSKDIPSWKQLLCLSLIAVGCSGFRPVYAILILIPTLLFFLEQEEKLSLVNAAYLICFILMFAPFLQYFFYIDGVQAIGDATVGHIGLTTILEGLGLFAMVLIALSDMLPKLVSYFLNKEKAKNQPEA